MTLYSDWLPIVRSQASEWSRPVIPRDVTTVMCDMRFSDTDEPRVYVVHPLTAVTDNTHPDIKKWYPSTAKAGDKVMAYGIPDEEDSSDLRRVWVWPDLAAVSQLQEFQPILLGTTTTHEDGVTFSSSNNDPTQQRIVSKPITQPLSLHEVCAPMHIQQLMESSALLPGEERTVDASGRESLSDLHDRYKRICPDGTGVLLKIPFKALVKNDEGAENWVTRHYMVAPSDATTAIKTLKQRDREGRFTDVLGAKELTELDHVGTKTMKSSDIQDSAQFPTCKGAPNEWGQELSTFNTMLTLRQCGDPYTIPETTKSHATIEELTKKMYTESDINSETETQKRCRRGWKQSSNPYSEHVLLQLPSDSRRSKASARVKFATARGKDLRSVVHAELLKQFSI